MTRIRKLLRLAEDQAGKPEGIAAESRAKALMETHGLQRSTMDLGAGFGNDFRHRAFELGAAEPWRRALVDAIAAYFDCVALYDKENTSVETYGPEHALPQVEYTYVVYMRQLRIAWRAHAEDLISAGLWKGLPKRRQIESREGFCVSFVLGVKERLDEDRRADNRDDPASYEAAMRQRKDLERWMRRAGVRWRARPTEVGDYSQEGFQAGKSAEVDAGLTGRRGPRRIQG
jgi:hypothetical protein